MDYVDLLIRKLRQIRRVTPVFAVLALTLLVGCARDERVKDAEKHAAARVENFAKNQSVIHDGVREHWRSEAKAHIDTKHDWTLDKLEVNAERGAFIEKLLRTVNPASIPADLANFKTYTPTEIIAAAKKTSDLRVKLYADVDAIVNKDKEVEAYTQRDLQVWRELNAKIDEYNKASSFNFFGLFGKGSVVEPPAAVPAPVSLTPNPEPPLKAEVVPIR